MIVIPYQDGHQGIAQQTAADLIEAFADQVPVECTVADSTAAWPKDSLWDDLLTVLHDEKEQSLTSSQIQPTTGLEKNLHTRLQVKSTYFLYWFEMQRCQVGWNFHLPFRRLQILNSSICRMIHSS